MNDISRVGVIGAVLGDLTDRDLVIEAATDNPETKSALFTELDGVVKRPGPGFYDYQERH